MTAGACAPRVGPSDYALAQPSGPYRLATGDRLRIIVFGQDNLSNIYAVDGSGRIAMPIFDQFAAAAAFETNVCCIASISRTIKSVVRVDAKTAPPNAHSFQSFLWPAPG